MKSPRFSIGKLMFFVGLVALNLGAGRLVWSAEPSILAELVPTALVLEFGTLRLIFCRGRRRVFWAAFLVAGSLAGFSFVWSMINHTAVNIGLDRVTGQRVRTVVPGLPSADRMWSVWQAYFALTMSGLEGQPVTAGILKRGDASTAALMGAVVCLPQPIIALAGGWLAILVAKAAGLRTRHRTAAALTGSACHVHEVSSGPRVSHPGDGAFRALDPGI